MAFTEFYCNASTGSNLNAGSTTGGAAVYTSTNGNWDGTSIFTPVDGSTPASTVSAGDWLSVYLDAATVAVFIARVVTVAAGVNGAITVSTTVKSGTAPASGATGRTVKAGGTWKGPNAAENFPFGFVTPAQTNVAGDCVRVTFIGTFNVTAAITHATLGPIVFQGGTSAAADGGKGTIDGGTSGASYVLFTLSGNQNIIRDLIFQNNGATSTSTGVAVSGDSCSAMRCVVNSVRGHGLLWSGTGGRIEECEAYSCNQSNTATAAGLSVTAEATFVRCVSHDNTGSNNSGYRATKGNFVGCIADSNGLHGWSVAVTSVTATLDHCDSYNNGTDGCAIVATTRANVTIENCNFIKNGGYGVRHTSTKCNVLFLNNGFGSGTQINTLGQTLWVAGTAVTEEGSVTYASNVTPWVDPANGDFRINLAAAINAGRGAFTQTAASYAGAIGYPDIGSNQHLESAAAGGILRHPHMTGGMVS